MAVLFVEAVVWAIEIGRDHIGEGDPILQLIGFELGQHEALRVAIRRFRSVRGTLPDIILAHRLRHLIGIGRRRACADDLCDACLTRRIDHIQVHPRIGVNRLCRKLKLP